MSKIILTVDDELVNNKIITFDAPCDSTGVTAFTINGVDYSIVDACGNDLTKRSNNFYQGGKVTISIRPDTMTATVLNGGSHQRTFVVDVFAQNWSSSAPYTQTIGVSGIRATDEPIADVGLGNVVEDNSKSLEDWAKVTRITTSNDSITVICEEECPADDLEIRLKVVY